MRETLKKTCESFILSRDGIKKAFKLESDYIYPVCADFFVTAGKTPERERLLDVRSMVRADAGIFSNFRGSVELPIVCKLSVSDEPASQWDRVRSNYRYLKEHFFGSQYLALAALLLLDSAKDEDIPELSERGKMLYKRMRTEHPFLTGSEDSVLALLLAQCRRNEDELVQEMEECYRNLNEAFPKGNGLQTSSHVLTLGEGKAKDKASRMIELYERITGLGVKYGKDEKLASLAALSLADLPLDSLATDISDADSFLGRQKGYGSVFGLDKRMRSMHAAMLVSADLSCGKLMDAVAGQTALAIIAAQQAAMCAIMASSAAAAAASASH